MAEITHEITLFAEPIARIGGFTITNSLLNSWVSVLVLILTAFLIKKRVAKIPRGFQNFFELILEGALKLSDSITGSRAKSEKIFPWVFTFFLFILFNNYLGLLPGIGSLGILEARGNQTLFIPLFRGATADLNTTLALSLMALVMTHVVGVVTVGPWHHLNKFLNFKAFLEIPKKVFREPMILFINPIKAFVGLVELIGEFAKALSLSLRLFGNIFAGEVLLAAVASIFAYVVPIPFMFLELIVGLVQALVFSMLTLVFASIAMTQEEH